MDTRKLIAGAAIVAGTVATMATTVSAHDCFNPNKPNGAGVNYTITGFGPDGPIFTQTGPGKGIGGFANVFGTDIHTIGNSGAIEVVGGPNLAGSDRACDGQGIDLLSACE